MKTVAIKCNDKTYEQFKSIKKELKMNTEGTFEFILKVFLETQRGENNDK